VGNKDTFSKFGDFLDDDSVVDVPAVVTDQATKPSSSYVVGSNQAPDSEISSAINRLVDALGIDISNYSPDDVLKDLDKINTDDLAFDLASSKIVSDLVSRTALKGIVVQSQMVNRIFDFLSQAYGSKGSPMDSDALLLIDKATSYLEKLFAIQDRYKKTGIVESLRHISDERKKKAEANGEETVTLTTHDIQLLIKQAQEADKKEKEKTEEDKDEK
jgi:hypothetical protein